MTVDALISMLEARKAWGRTCDLDVGKLPVRFEGGQGRIYSVQVDHGELVCYTERS